MTESTLLDLLLQIHQAAAEPEFWPQVLASIRSQVQGTFSSLLCLDAAGRLVLPALDVSTPEDLLLDYSRDWAESDELYRLTASRGAGQVVTSAELLSPSLARRSAVWNEFYLPRDLGRFLAATPDPQGGASAMLVVYRGRAQREFGRRETETLERVLPHVSSALRVHLELQEALAFGRALGEALEALPLGVILLDGRAQVLFVNAAAGQVLDARDGLSLVRGALHAARSEDSAAIRRLVRSCLPSSWGIEPAAAGGVIGILRPAERTPYSLRIEPIRVSGLGIRGREPAVAVLFADPDREPAAPHELLHQLYGLTPAESRLAVELCEGSDVAQIAELHGLSVATVRTHLRHLLEKTGTRRQGELVSLLLRGPLALLR